MRFGLRLLLAVVLLGGAAVYFWPRDDARSILDRAITAHGGPAALARSSTGKVKIEGTTGIRPLVTTISREEIFQLPGRFKRIEKMNFGGEQRTRVSVLKDGQWREKIDQEAVETHPAAEGDDKDSLAQTLRILTDLRSQRIPLVKIDDIDVEGRLAYGVRIGAEEQVGGQLYFDKQTHLLRKRQRRRQHPETERELVEERLFLNYKPFDGVLLPTTIRTYYDGRQYEELVVIQASFPDHLDESLFESLKPE
jgi:hypothetical protein